MGSKVLLTDQLMMKRPAHRAIQGCSSPLTAIASFVQMDSGLMGRTVNLSQYFYAELIPPPPLHRDSQPYRHRFDVC